MSGSCASWPCPGQKVRNRDRLPPARPGLPADTPLARVQAGVLRPGALAAGLLPGGPRRNGPHCRAGRLLGRTAAGGAADRLGASPGAARGLARYLQAIDPATEV